jgi:hypothetical protein
MKNRKKVKRTYPEVQVLGDLHDIKKLVKAINKKDTLVIFRNAETVGFHARVENEMVQYAEEDITRLAKDYRIVYFDFYPGRKPVIAAEPGIRKSQKEIEGKQEKKEKKEKKEKI